MKDTTYLIRALAAGEFIVTLHGRQRMAQRSVSEFDIMECGRTAVEVKLQNDGKYKIFGFDLDGDELDVVCLFEDHLIIITVF
jgi:hypothetical protein